MPITSSVDYIPVMDEFLDHWTSSGGTITLPENGLAVVQDDFSDLRTALDTTRTGLQGKLNDLENARVVLEQIRKEAGDRIAEFNRRIRAEFPTNKLFNRLPAVPNRTAGREAFISAMDDALDLWTRVNAQPVSPVFAPPMLLMGGLTKAQFLTLRTQVDAAFTSRGSAELGTTEIRLERNDLQERDARAELSWTESTDAQLDHYELRATPGLEYSGEDESIVATFPPGTPPVHTTTTGFGLPGNAVTYKLYVRLTTGNEAGSDAVTIVRPV